MIGTTVKSRYRIYDRLGAGGSATVYLARDGQTGGMVIVKVVHENLVDHEFIMRFKREIEILSHLNNQHVIHLYDWGLEEFHPESGQSLSYIVAEFIEGHTLADIIDTRGALPEHDALAITRQVATALEEIHAQRIIHRDIKSQNIMLTPENRAKLIDFGIAKASSHANVTGSSIFAGTVYYAAPEQILGARDVDQRADIYSLGVVLYEMLSANLPVRARELGTVASRIVSGQLEPLQGISQPVDRLVMAMLATNVHDRIQTATDVISGIDRIGGDHRKADLPDRPAPRNTTTLNIKATPPSAGDAAVVDAFRLTAPNGRRISIEHAEVVIGRSHPRDSFIPDIDLNSLNLEEARTASRRHCRIYVNNGNYFIEDLGSMNGTSLNGKWLDAGVVYPLKSGDQVVVGRLLLIFEKNT